MTEITENLALQWQQDQEHTYTPGVGPEDEVIDAEGNRKGDFEKISPAARRTPVWSRIQTGSRGEAKGMNLP